MITIAKIKPLWLNIALLVNTFVGAQDDQQPALKAAFIYHFTQYIEWSNDAGSKTFNISILGKSPITKQLVVVTKGEKVRGKEIIVQEYENINNIEQTHILFVPQNSPVSIEKIVSFFAGLPVLIITEKKGSAENGSHINFFVSENKLKFEINMKAANRAGLKISSILLKHAIIVA